MKRATGELADRITGAALAAASLWYLWQAWRLPRFRLSVVVDAHVFPAAVGLALLACSALLAARPQGLPQAGSGEAFSAPFDWRAPGVARAAWLCLLSVAYAVVLEPLGFVASTVAFLVAAAAVLGWRRWALGGAVAAGFAGGTWYLFTRVLTVPLPAGPWGF